MNEMYIDELSIDAKMNRIRAGIGSLKIISKKPFLLGKWHRGRHYQRKSIFILSQVAHQFWGV